jgi:fatty acid desaturase
MIAHELNVDKRSLHNAEGLGYIDFRKTLRADYARLWLDIGLAYGVLALTMAALIGIRQWPGWTWIVALPCGAFLIGYAITFITLFVHEAVHYNVAASRPLNDRLSNLLIGIWAGLEVRRYRRVHLQHHRLLGQTDDPERSYHSCLDLQFLLESVTGVRVLRVLLSYRNQLRGQNPAMQHIQPEQPPWSFTLVGAVLLHAGIVLGCLWHGDWPAAIAWIFGAAVVFPFLASLRQLLEHREPSAGALAATNRLFGDGPFASTFGGAGFNRHLLHHWDSGVSCTRLRDLEQYLLTTPAAAMLRARQTTYWQAFKSLYGH